SHQLWLRLAVGVLADAVGRRAEELAHVIKALAVRAPHGGAVLDIKRRHLAVVRAVGVANPAAIPRRAAAALAVPAPGAAHVADPNVAEVAERHLFAVRGNVRRPAEADRLLSARGTYTKQCNQSQGDGTVPAHHCKCSCAE